MWSGIACYAAINPNVYNSLSPDLKKAFDDNVGAAKNEFWNTWVIATESGMKFAKENGCEIINPSADDKVQWEKALAFLTCCHGIHLLDIWVVVCRCHV